MDAREVSLQTAGRAGAAGDGDRRIRSGPDKTLRSLGVLRRWGPSSAAAYTGGAIRFPDRPAIVDDRGTLTFAEVDRRTNALAHALAEGGIGDEDSVAIMCRNHRGFVEATVACAKLGAGALYLNTAFAGPQIADVLQREDPAAVIYDEEFAELVQRGRRPAAAHRRLERAGRPGVSSRRSSS